jgi:hypothetical protein
LISVHTKEGSRTISECRPPDGLPGGDA